MTNAAPTPPGPATSCFCLLLASTTLLACTTPSPRTPASTSDAIQADTDLADTANLAKGDAGYIDLGYPEPRSDVEDTSRPYSPCPGGHGCACSQHKGCDSEICVPSITGSTCVRRCGESCPANHACTQWKTLPGGDPVFVCMPYVAALCRPCTSHATCHGWCMDQDNSPVGFCSHSCGPGAACPEGFACASAKTFAGAGLPTKQKTVCVPTPDPGQSAGVCPCVPALDKSQPSTPCYATKMVGGEPVSCLGTRSCTVDGWTECDAPDVAKEVCDGVDNDCDGATDNGACDDGSPCTHDACDPAKFKAGVASSGCTNSAHTGFCDADGSACTPFDKCLDGLCVAGAAKVCDDQDPCTTDACVPTTGACQFLPVAGDCGGG